MKLMTAAVLTAVMLAAAPAWADRGDKHGRGHGYGHGHKHWKEARHYHPHYAPPRHVVRREVVHYYEPAPVYYAPQPVGIHVILPNIYIPIR